MRPAPGCIEEVATGLTTLAIQEAADRFDPPQRGRRSDLASSAEVAEFPMRLVVCAAVLAATAIALSGCLAATVAGTAVGVTAKAASMTVRGAGAVVGAIVP
jgi:hypothetical protein